jgi:hypothetical protein
MAQTIFMFRIDLGFNPDKGYGATVLDVQRQMVKGVKGSSIRQLLRNISAVVAEEEQKKRRFPMESGGPKLIITPEEAGNGIR